MKEVKIEQLKRKLKDHWDFFNIQNRYSESEITNWVADATILLNEIGVSETIIKIFIETFEPVETEEKGYHMHNKCRKIGPFVSWRDYLGHWGPYEHSDFSKITNVKIAYRSANAVLKKGLEEERIVPKWLINELGTNGNYNNIISSLELVQTKYESRDPIDLPKNVITLLENIVDLEPSLKKSGKMIGEKLGILMGDEKLLDKFGVHKDIVRALSNSRAIRNIHIHKEVEIKYDIPFLVACSFAYLAIIFLEITISTGELIKNDKIVPSVSLSKSILKPTK